MEDRKSQGVFQGQSVASNMTVAMLDELSVEGRARGRAGRASRVEDFIERLGVRPPRPGIAIDALSGGNQQKVLFGRSLINGLKAAHPR